MTRYRGRFAPSPTGKLHLGSLATAVGSYLRAKNQKGKWLLRMEDVDSFREESGAADAILKALEAHGLYWDEDVVYQSKRHSFYQDALDVLSKQQMVYECRCSRKFLKRMARVGDFGIIYPGTCRDSQKNEIDTDKTPAIRLVTDDTEYCFDDLLLGQYCQKLESEIGDFIIKRSDGLFAYQLAVVVDDHLQGITEIVRGEDLLSTTFRQNYLQSLLGYEQPDYVHLPLILNEQGQKLSKQTHAEPLDSHYASKNLISAIKFLGFQENAALYQESPETILQWTEVHYNSSLLP